MLQEFRDEAQNLFIFYFKNSRLKNRVRTTERMLSLLFTIKGIRKGPHFLYLSELYLGHKAFEAQGEHLWVLGSYKLWGSWVKLRVWTR